jgi:itaconate CoA-transferase
VLQQPALATDERFNTNARRTAAREALREIIAQTFTALSAGQVVARLDAAGIANAQVNDMAQVWSHSQLRARQRWVDVATPAGPVPALLPPGAHNAESVRMNAVPSLGQHSRTILAELGYSAEQITELQRDGVL